MGERFVWHGGSGEGDEGKEDDNYNGDGEDDRNDAKYS